MSYGAAHMSATSLPIGGKNTNAVLAGHTGYIGRIFFDNLRNLKIGDWVSITNYWDTLNYKVVETKVWFRKLKDAEIERYIATQEPFDKAGSYGIQGKAACFVDKINGSYSNVVGLPLSQVYTLLQKAKVIE